MKIVINPEYSFLTDFINNLSDRFATEGEIIYNERNVLKRFQVQGVDMVVKSFKVPILVNRIAYTFFRKSKACRSYEYALEISKRGSNTPAPVAYIEEYRGGLLNRSYYISLYKADSVTIRSYLDVSNADTEAVQRSFVAFTIGLHRAGILHIDYSPGNILVETMPEGAFSFSIIDINRLCFKTVSQEEALHNFDRLALSADVSTRLAEIYAMYCSLDRDETVKKINEYSDRFFLKKTIKRAIKTIRREKGWLSVFFGPLQQYFYLRRFRMLFQNGCREGCIYETERNLYLTYLKPVDDRQVLNRKYHYEA